MDALGGVQILRTLQSVHTPFLDRFFGGVTLLGSEEFYLIVIPVLYWCFDRTLGRRAGRLFLFSLFLNVWLKGLFHTARPSPDQVRVIYRQTASGYAFPSGHTQGSTTFWGYLALRRRRAWLSILAVLLISLVALSRLYLGVHWPVDVAGGLLAGFLLAWLWTRIGLWWESELAAIATPLRAAGAFLVPFLLLLLDHSPEGVEAVGVLAGFSGGAVLAESWAPPGEFEGVGRRLAKAVFGLAGLALLHGGLKGLLPPTVVFAGLRYGLMGLWVGLLVPWIFALAWPVEGRWR